MAIRNLRYEGDPILKKKSREVEVIDEKLQTLIDDMIDTMHKYNGVGLAAVQVGILKRVVVIDLYDDKGVKVIAFGKDDSDKVMIETDLKRNADGSFYAEEEGTYYIKYTVDNIKYGSIFKIQKIRLIHFVEPTEEKEVVGNE